MFEEAPDKVIAFLRENKQFAKPCLCFITEDPEVAALAAEHDVETAAAKAAKTEAAKKLKEEKVRHGFP